MTIAVLTAAAKPMLEGRLPGWLEPRWISDLEQLKAVMPEAEIAWLDGLSGGSDHAAMIEGNRLAMGLKWLNTVRAGVEVLPLALFRQRGLVLTNGAGINAIPIAEYAVMGMLSLLKGYAQVVQAQGRREWLKAPPGRRELYGSKALVLGAGEIGGAIAERLAAFGVDVSRVRRSPASGELGMADWRARLGAFDWVIVALPATPETQRSLGAAEFAAMKPGACIVNIARGTIIDQPALVEALRAGHLGGAFLDVTDPEPLPADHPLWTFPNVEISMHLSGRSQTLVYQRGAERFLDNLARWERGGKLVHAVDLEAGY